MYTMIKLLDYSKLSISERSQVANSPLLENQFLDSLNKSFLNQVNLDLRKEKWTFLNREFIVLSCELLWKNWFNKFEMKLDTKDWHETCLILWKWIRMSHKNYETYKSNLEWSLINSIWRWKEIIASYSTLTYSAWQGNHCSGNNAIEITLYYLLREQDRLTILNFFYHPEHDKSILFA